VSEDHRVGKNCRNNIGEVGGDGARVDDTPGQTNAQFLSR
jgi:hypothetical protein